jgi:hypothetical protein
VEQMWNRMKSSQKEAAGSVKHYPQHHLCNAMARVSLPYKNNVG